MKFSCEKALLLDAINTASRAVPAKTSVPALEGLLFHADTFLTISGFDTNTGIRTKVSAEITEPGEVVINAKLLGSMVRNMPDDMVTIVSDGKNNIRLYCGDTQYNNIAGLPADSYPELPEVEDAYSVSISQGVLRAMISQTVFSVSTNDARPVHTGSLFEVDDGGLTVVAVDGFRLALRREKIERMEGGAFRFIAPGSALGEVEKICADVEDLVTIILGNRHILFEIGDTQLICRRIEGDFLDYKSAIPRNNPISLIVETKAMIESLNRVSVIINEKVKSPVRCIFKDDKVLLSAKTGSGEANDTCIVAGSGGDLEIGFNNRYLSEALRFAPAENVKLELNTGISPCVIVPTDGEENFIYMVLPILLRQ